MKGIFFLLLCFTAGQSIAQYPEKKWFDTKDSTYGYYVVVPPASGRLQGMLILFDGYGGNADGFLAETKIHNVAWANDLLTVCVPTGPRFYLDSSMTRLIGKIVSPLLQTYSLRKDQVAIGGMSAGGTIALRYAELCKQHPEEFPVQPQAVFAVDSPLDLVGLYESSARDLKKNNSGWWRGECQMIIDYFKSTLGDPATDLSKYKTVSPFLRMAADSTNEKSLAQTAVRSYHDVDVNWFIQNRGRSLYETNLLDGSEFISRLVALGNKRAEFMDSKIEGRRSNGQRHPHSWNIVEETELVQWLRKSLHFYPDQLEKVYSYEAPPGWEKETILFPMDFAPGVKYKGFEELRFAPGWGQDSLEKWAYTILWWLDGDYKFDEKILQQNLQDYFTGLTHNRASSDKLDMNNFKPAKASVLKVNTEKGDNATYTASASIFDAQVTRKPGMLYYKIHVKSCAEKGKAILLFEVAGNPFTAKVWEALDGINRNFTCGLK